MFEREHSTITKISSNDGHTFAVDFSLAFAQIRRVNSLVAGIARKATLVPGFSSTSHKFSNEDLKVIYYNTYFCEKNLLALVCSQRLAFQSNRQHMPNDLTDLSHRGQISAPPHLGLPLFEAAIFGAPLSPLVDDPFNFPFATLFPLDSAITRRGATYAWAWWSTWFFGACKE